MLGDGFASLVGVLLFVVLWPAAPLISLPYLIEFGVLVVVAAWQAWLLFRSGWRFAVWVATLVIIVLLRLFAADGNFLPPADKEVGAIVWAILALLLVEVRRRPWILGLSSLGFFVAMKWYSTPLEEFGNNAMNAMLDLFMERLGIGSFGGVSELFWYGFIAGWMLLHGAPLAVLLAFCMPPIVRESRPLSPPHADSTRA